ncbi:hypothetical protein FNV43_RR19776 [Rhamnella rubrinervis]|uniref:Uncharacterized protein n=1 Tax=Rhamnella rubrinervis TaxID=2594499 RepID=A0A8K0GU01_9ROSA|nr:hypothetical protein FNV43_RR19776 [Rhamnella rubrinervis]
MTTYQGDKVRPLCRGFSPGIVVDSRSDNFLVDINPALAFLPVLAFEGGTRRNIPKFEFNKAVEFHGGGNAAPFGPLKDGYMFECSMAFQECEMRLLSLPACPVCPVLEELGKKLSFETAVNGASPSTVITVANALMNSESLSMVQQRIMVEKLLQNLKLSKGWQVNIDMGDSTLLTCRICLMAHTNRLIGSSTSINVHVFYYAYEIDLAMEKRYEPCKSSIGQNGYHETGMSLTVVEAKSKSLSEPKKKPKRRALNELSQDY